MLQNQNESIDAVIDMCHISSSFEPPAPKGRNTMVVMDLENAAVDTLTADEMRIKCMLYLARIYTTMLNMGMKYQIDSSGNQ